MITRKIAPALAAGCAVVLKPASETPFSALALAALAEEAGLPAGLFNVITGGSRAIGGELTGSPLVRKLSFTGSTEVGRLLLGRSEEHTSELQSLMRSSYAVFCLKNKNKTPIHTKNTRIRTIHHP